MTQWTIMARPGHPIFLDALGRTLRKSEEVARREKEAKEVGEVYIPETAVRRSSARIVSPPTADDQLEWTGPGVL